MKNNIKKVLLLSAFGLQIFGSTAFATVGSMYEATAVDGITTAQKNNSTLIAPSTSNAINTYYIGEPTLRAIATALGNPISSTSTSTATNTQSIAAIVAALSTAVSNMPTSNTVTTALGTYVKGSDLTGSYNTLSGLIAALPSASSMLVPLKLTTVVDNLVNGYFNNTALANSSYKFAGSSGSLSSGDSSGAYVITAGQSISKFFAPTGPALNASLFTPAQKLTILLRAVFGITLANYQTAAGNVLSLIPVPTTTTNTQYFGNIYSDNEDSGTILTAFMTYVLGANRDGNSVASNTAPNKWGGSSVFNRINAAAAAAGLYKADGTSLTVPTGGLNGPSVYFNNVLATALPSNSSTYLTSTGADVMRLKCLLQDLIVPASS